MPARKGKRGFQQPPPSDPPEQVFDHQTPGPAASTRPPASSGLDRTERALRERAYEEIPTDQIELVGQNRFPASYDTETEQLFREDIERHGGNEVPAAVRRNPNPEGARYQLIYGHRRFYACRDLGLPLRAYVRDADDARLVADRLRENSNREDQPPYERALLMREALELGAVRTQRELAALTGTSPATITHVLALADLPPSILTLVGDNPNHIPLRLGYQIAQKAKERAGEIEMQAQEVLENEGAATSEQEARSRLSKLFDMIQFQGRSGREKNAGTPDQRGSSAGDESRPVPGDEIETTREEDFTEQTAENDPPPLIGQDGNVRGHIRVTDDHRTVIEFDTLLDDETVASVRSVLENIL